MTNYTFELSDEQIKAIKDKSIQYDDMLYIKCERWNIIEL